MQVVIAGVRSESLHSHNDESCLRGMPPAKGRLVKFYHRHMAESLRRIIALKRLGRILAALGCGSCSKYSMTDVH